MESFFAVPKNNKLFTIYPLNILLLYVRIIIEYYGKQVIK